MEIKQEAIYEFKYRDAVRTSVAYVDSIEGRRHMGGSDPKPQIFDKTALNYKGTGAELQTIEAELLSENVLIEQSDWVIAELYYRLPDVDAYVKARYILESDYMSPPTLSSYIETKFLDKLVAG